MFKLPTPTHDDILKNNLNYADGFFNTLRSRHIQPSLEHERACYRSILQRHLRPYDPAPITPSTSVQNDPSHQMVIIESGNDRLELAPVLQPNPIRNYFEHYHDFRINPHPKLLHVGGSDTIDRDIAALTFLNAEKNISDQVELVQERIAHLAAIWFRLKQTASSN